jgi:hypothetical protein
MKAIRDNLDSTDVDIDLSDVLGIGGFRITYRGTYTNGERKNQSAACKKFKDASFEYEFYECNYDFKVIDKAVEFATSWNDDVCRYSFEHIQFTRGNYIVQRGVRYLMEPIIQPYYKYTNNAGWINSENCTSIQVLEAFCHYTYHKSGGNLIVCDLQGLFKVNRYAFFKSRYILTDPAICSRKRHYGPTDMGEKGIESFFVNHVCNKFCRKYGGGHWQRPRNPTDWFTNSRNQDNGGHTCFMKLQDTYKLQTMDKSYL